MIIDVIPEIATQKEKQNTNGKCRQSIKPTGSTFRSQQDNK